MTLNWLSQLTLLSIDALFAHSTALAETVAITSLQDYSDELAAADPSTTLVDPFDGSTQNGISLDDRPRRRLDITRAERTRIALRRCRIHELLDEAQAAPRPKKL